MQRGLQPARSYLAYAAWVHGYSLEVEFPDRITRQIPYGFYCQVEGVVGSENWFHLAIPTPVIVDDQRLLADSVMLRYRSLGGALVHSVQVFDGEQMIANHREMNNQPSSWAFERYKIAEKPEVKSGLGIWIGVRFPNAGAKLEFSSVG